MKAAVISLGSKSSLWVAEAMKKYFDEVETLDIRNIEINLGEKGFASVLYNGEAIDKYDCVYAKGSFRYATVLRALTILLEKKCYMPFEAPAFTIVHDKILTHQELQRFDIPMPKTYLSTTIDSAKKILKKINYPIIMKFPQGTQGKGVMFAESYAAASSVFDAMHSLKQPILIQEYIETSGVDIRALVVGGKVVACMKRKSASDDKRANLHAGGKAESYELDEQAKRISINTAKALKSEICGVDLLEGIKGHLVIEANLSPGLQGITEATNIDIADKIARFLYEKTNELINSKIVNTKEILEEIGINKPENKELISCVDFRANRMLLPELITRISEFSDDDELLMNVKKGKLSIEKLNISKD